MAVYIVTGKLGAGKTLLLVMQILNYLKARRRVAVNVDVFMNKLCRPGNTYSRLVRLPDLPTAADLRGLGVGHEAYDEEMFGGIFLDEAGVWLNSRDWNQGGRSDLLKFFLYLRKRRWDLWLCVQNVNVIDKQVRESIAEHVVYINRWDRLKLPFIFRWPLRLLTFGRWNGRLPKLHQAIVKYGAKFNSPKVDDWYYRGEEFYDYYDTTQEYDEGYDKGSYSMLPPGYWHRRLPRAPRNWRFFMRTTRIFFRRTRVLNAFFLGGACTLLVAAPLFASIAFIQLPGSVQEQPRAMTSAPVTTPDRPLAEEFPGLRIATYGRLAGRTLYVFLDERDLRISQDDLAARGITVKDRGPREALLVRDADYHSVFR
jgi:hypothetical protein